jgi:hypothetical protein
VLRAVLAVVGVVYGISFIVFADKWRRFFSRRRPAPRWLPYAFALGALYWAGFVFFTGFAGLI